MLGLLLVPAAICLLALLAWRPHWGLVAWVLALVTGPDYWLNPVTGGPEATAGMVKAFGLLVLALLALRRGVRLDRFNPAFAFAFMFCTGLLHGLHPGLSLGDSARSLLGSAAPFLFGFVRLGPQDRAAIRAAVVWGPLFALGVAAMLALTGVDEFYEVTQGAVRLGGTAQAPFLGGFALVGLYAACVALAGAPRPGLWGLAGVNLLIIMASGARAPLALGGLVLLALLVAHGRVLALAAAGAMAAGTALAAGQLGFVRAVDLAQLGEATDLSNRTQIWPFFWTAIQQSPFVGWGVGAGKVVVPVTAALAKLLGTNAAHDEYLRIGTEGGAIGLSLLVVMLALWVRRGTAGLPRGQKWLMRLVFIAFAIHSATDNTLIATTGAAFFLWASAVFADAENGSRPAA